MNWLLWTLIPLMVTGLTAYYYRDISLVPFLTLCSFIVLLLLSAAFEKEEHCMCPTCQPIFSAAIVHLFLVILMGMIWWIYIIALVAGGIFG